LLPLHGNLLISAVFITNPSETDKHIGACGTPHTSTGYDDHMCQWRRERAYQSFQPTTLRGAA